MMPGFQFYFDSCLFSEGKMESCQRRNSLPGALSSREFSVLIFSPMWNHSRQFLIWFLLQQIVSSTLQGVAWNQPHSYHLPHLCCDSYCVHSQHSCIWYCGQGEVSSSFISLLVNPGIPWYLAVSPFTQTGAGFWPDSLQLWWFPLCHVALGLHAIQFNPHRVPALPLLVITQASWPCLWVCASIRHFSACLAFC